MGAYKKHGEDPLSVLSELIHEASYGDGSPFGSSFFASDLSQLRGVDTLEFRSSNVKAGSTYITASGVESESLQTWAETAFQSLSTGSAKAPSTKFVGGDIKLKAETKGTTYTAVAFPIPSGEVQKSYEALNHILGGKLAGTPVFPFIASYAHGGIFGFYSTSLPSETGSNLEAGITALKEVAKGTENVEVAKSQLALSKSILLEGELATSVLLDALRAGEPIANYVKYDNVTPSSVSAAAVTSLKSTPAYAVLGCTVGTPSFETILNMLK